jgi:predicted metal-dependent phosphoesterase TrpH
LRQTKEANQNKDFIRSGITADLHMHSRFSDGAMTPTELIALMKSEGKNVVALTDHDSTAGVAEAVAAGVKAGIKVVSGIEISSYSITEIHILGYNFDVLNSVFCEKLQKIKDMRRVRNQKILEKLKALGIEIEGEFGEDKGRFHIAQAMIDAGFSTSVPDAFDKYLGHGGAAYVTSERLRPFEAVKLIADLGGVAVLAHPRYFVAEGTLNSIIEGLIPYGLKGIEAYYAKNLAGETAILASAAKARGLLLTGGSDLHNIDQQYSPFSFPVTDKLARALGL